VEREEEEEDLSVICITVIVKGNGRDESTEKMKSRRPRTEPWGTPQDDV